jgi:hypothetical protein
MGQFIPAFVSVLKGGTIAKGAGLAVKTAAIAANTVKVATPIVKTAAQFGGPAAVTSAVMKGAAPKPPSTPTQISQAPTVIAAGEQAKKYEGDNQMDLLSTIIAGQGKRKNKLG